MGKEETNPSLFVSNTVVYLVNSIMLPKKTPETNGNEQVHLLRMQDLQTEVSSILYITQ